MRLWHQHPVIVEESEDRVEISLDRDYQSEIPVQDQLTLQEIWDAFSPPSILETTDTMVRWGSRPHSYIIVIACRHNNVGCEDIAGPASNDPDDPEWYNMAPGPIWTIFHTYMDGYVLDLLQGLRYPPGVIPNPSIPYGIAPINVGIHALKAKNAYRHNEIDQAFQSLGHASHYLTDVGNPLHTSAALFSNPVLGVGNIGFVHNYYEIFVSDHWQDYSKYIEQTTERKRVNNPSLSTIKLAEYSHARSHKLIYRVFLDTLMNKPRENDQRIHQITKECLIETTKYTNGLVDYVIRDGVASFTITASADTGGMIVPSGIIPVKFGESKTFSIQSNSGYHIDTLLVDGESVTSRETYTFTDIDKSHVIHATFTKDAPASSSEWIWSRDGWTGWDHEVTWSECEVCSEYGPLLVGDHGEHGGDVNLRDGHIIASVGRVFSDTKGDGWNTMIFEGLLSASDRPGRRWMNITINDRQLFMANALESPPGDGEPFQIRLNFPTSKNLNIRISHGQEGAYGPRFMMQYYRITLSNDNSVKAGEPRDIIHPQDPYERVNITVSDTTQSGG